MSLPSLAPHLHTDKCNKIIEEFQACRKQKTLKRLFGECDHLYYKVRDCMQEEKEQKVRQSFRRRSSPRQVTVLDEHAPDVGLKDK